MGTGHVSKQPQPSASGEAARDSASESAWQEPGKGNAADLWLAAAAGPIAQPARKRLPADVRIDGD